MKTNKKKRKREVKILFDRSYIIVICPSARGNVLVPRITYHCVFMTHVFTFNYKKFPANIHSPAPTLGLNSRSVHA